MSGFIGLGLPQRYRFVAKNETGQTIATGGLKVYARRKKLDATGALTFEGSEATLLSNTSTVADGGYESGTVQDNDASGTPLWLSGDFVFEVTAPASSSGPVKLFLHRATDDSATPTNIDTNGEGELVAVLYFTTSGTKRASFSL